MPCDITSDGMSDASCVRPSNEDILKQVAKFETAAPKNNK